jgi:glutaredoxin-related protein
MLTAGVKLLGMGASFKKVEIIKSCICRCFDCVTAGVKLLGMGVAFKKVEIIKSNLHLLLL